MVRQHLLQAGIPSDSLELAVDNSVLNCREDSLERFGVMGVRHQQLQEQLRPVLRFYAAHPKAVNQSNAGKPSPILDAMNRQWHVQCSRRIQHGRMLGWCADLLPVLLSTMKLPEMDAEEQELLKAGASTRGQRSYQELGVRLLFEILVAPVQLSTVHAALADRL